MSFALHIRRGYIINTDPQRRCYYGAYAKSETVWGDWELWLKDMTFETREDAEHAARQFAREDQQFKVVELNMNTYQAFYKGQTKEVQATSSFKAQQLAAKQFKAKREYEVTVMLVAIDGEQVTHSTGAL